MLGTLWQIAWRNAKRHRAQAIAAAAAVAVGTCVLAASLSAGQAAEAGITQVAFDILGETDELVRSEGDFFFPEEAADRFTQETQVRRGDVTTGKAIAYLGNAGTPDGLTEPDVFMVGFPPEDPGFQGFDPVDGSGELTGSGVLVNQRLADALDVGAGDTIEARYGLPMDPLVPTVHTFDGNVTSATGPADLPLVGGEMDPTASSHSFEVEDTATRIVAVLVWGSPENTTDLDLRLTSPDGETVSNTNGSTGDPDVPAILNATAEGGQWTTRVTAKAAADQPYRLFVVTLRPAFSIEELREARQRLDEMGPLGEQIQQRIQQGRTTELTVDGVVSGEGKGGFLGEPAVFFGLDQLQSLLERQGEINLIRVSNPGDVRGGLAQTDEVTPELRAALNTTQASFQDPSVQALEVETSKADIVERAEEAGAQFTRFLTTLSSFTIVAGILLVVNLFTMLAEERRVELSVMRAMGLERRHLVGAFTMEGTLYALPGGPIGAVAGIGLAYGLIQAINDFIATEGALPIPFVIEPWTPAVAALIGILFTVAAVAVTGYRLSGLHIASGLKGQTDPEATGRKRWLPLALVGAGLIVTPLFWVSRLYTALIVGPMALVYGGALWIARAWPDHLGRFLGALLVLPYGLWTILAFDEIPAAEVPLVSPLRGTLMILAGVVLLLNLPGLPRLLKGTARRFGRWAPATMVALAYPIKKQMRTGLTASMFALVLLVLAVFSSFFTVFEVDPAREAGGYDLYAETNLPVEDLEAWAQANLDQRPASLDQVSSVDQMAVVRVVGGDVVTIEGQQVNYNGPPVDWFYGIDQGFAENNGYDLVSRSDRFGTDETAYRAVASQQDLAVVSRVYDFDEAGRLGRIDGGEPMTVDLVSGTVNLTVVGAQEQQYLGGIFIDEALLQDLFPTHGAGFLIQVEEGQDPVEVARAMERDYQAMGLDVESIEERAIELQSLNARFFNVLQVFLGLGLVIGVSSLGIVTAKSALEREHELGVLRAMGLPKEHITWSLVSESLFTAVLGILPGIAIGVAVAYAAWLAFFAEAGVAFTIPWTSIVVLSAISLVATVVSTIGPARRAAKTDIPAAVRVEG